MPKNLKYTLYGLLVTVLFFGLLEVIARIFGLANPSYITPPLPGEWQGLEMAHEELFWSLVPGVEKEMQNGAVAKINSLGFRGDELLPKQPDEFRILSLGESTTFGALVENDETYAAFLEKYLDSTGGGTAQFSVLNCGVSAYSSFQGLKFLELYGLTYQPDMVIIYFELNDYLPSTLRNHGHHENSIIKTDMQLYHSQQKNWARKIINHSALLQFLNNRIARQKMKRLQKSATQKPLTDIGLSENLIAPNRLHLIGNKTPIPAKLDESTLGQRVSEEERVEILHHFKRICEENNITLVVIHPSYQHSSPHECVLTAFCKNNNVPMFEAYSSLHPPELPPGSLFLDVWHPGVEGHRRLGRDLAHFLTPLIFRK